MITATASLDSIVAATRRELAAHGFALLSSFSSDPTRLLALARALGPLYVPGDVDPAAPLIESRPSEEASHLAPFDSADAIGWHNDFSTHEHRAAVSLACLARRDPCGADYGAWRVASGDDVMAALGSSPGGAAIVEFLLARELPFSFTRDGAPGFFRVLEPRDIARGRLGLRFYGRALRDGARLAYGRVPRSIERAIAAVELAADRVGRTLSLPAGSLLVTDNWHALHDRLAQTVAAGLPLRRSLLCFVEALHEMPAVVAADPMS